jgi:hypothetical protein
VTGSRPAIEGPDDILWKKYWGASLLNSLPHIENEIAAIRAIQKPPYKVRVEVLSGEDRHQNDGDWSLAEV